MLKFFTPKSKCFTKYDAFCLFRLCMKGSKLWKNCIHQKHVRMVGGGGGMHPHVTPGSALLALTTMSLTTTPTSRFGFSMMRGKFCHRCFETTAPTALARFGHFTLKTRVRFQKGGSDPQTPSWLRHCLLLIVFLAIRQMEKLSNKCLLFMLKVLTETPIKQIFQE